MKIKVSSCKWQCRNLSPPQFGMQGGGIWIALEKTKVRKATMKVPLAAIYDGTSHTIVGLMAAATLLMSADGAFAGAQRDAESGKDKSKGLNSSSIKFTYPVETPDAHPDLVVLVRSAEAGPPKTCLGSSKFRRIRFSVSKFNSG